MYTKLLFITANIIPTFSVAIASGPVSVACPVDFYCKIYEDPTVPPDCNIDSPPFYMSSWSNLPPATNIPTRAHFVGSNLNLQNPPHVGYCTYDISGGTGGRDKTKPSTITLSIPDDILDSFTPDTTVYNNHWVQVGIMKIWSCLYSNTPNACAFIY